MNSDYWALHKKIYIQMYDALDSYTKQEIDNDPYGGEASAFNAQVKDTVTNLLLLEQKKDKFEIEN